MPALDHVFAFCRPGAPEQQRLLAAGLRVGRSRRHVGQGTENVCFFFANLMLELIWIADDAEARQPAIAPLGLAERARWRDHGASPFGICLRASGAERAADLPFPAFPYAAPYLPAGVTMPIATSAANRREPLLFALPDGIGWNPPDVAHPLWQRHAACHFTVPELPANSPLGALRVPDLTVARGERHHLTITLTPTTGATIDLAPELPVTLHC